MERLVERPFHFPQIERHPAADNRRDRHHDEQRPQAELEVGASHGCILLPRHSVRLLMGRGTTSIHRSFFRLPFGEKSLFARRAAACTLLAAIKGESTMKRFVLGLILALAVVSAHAQEPALVPLAPVVPSAPVIPSAFRRPPSFQRPLERKVTSRSTSRRMADARKRSSRNWAPPSKP